MYGKILVAIDSTPESAQVLDQARGLALATDSQVHVLHVQGLEVLGGLIGAAAVVEDETEQEAGQLVKTAVDGLTAAGVTATGSTLETPRETIAEEIRAQVKEIGAGLLILGARRHGALATLFVGSVSDGLVHQAPCPLLLVP
jgi:nucleotide-binding universal stress UspA family protein